jgi:hypothetical protein
MKVRILAILAASVVFLLLSSCDNVQMITSERITFALVIHTRAYDTKMVYADVHDHDLDGAMLETVHAALEPYTTTANDSWAKMTTNEALPNGQRYTLEFYIDMDGNATLSTNDLKGVQVFEIRAGESWTETKYFYEDLTTVP